MSEPKEIIINPSDKITLTGELIIWIHGLIGVIPSKDSAKVYIELQKQIEENYSEKQISEGKV